VLLYKLPKNDLKISNKIWIADIIIRQCRNRGLSYSSSAHQVAAEGAYHAETVKQNPLLNNFCVQISIAILPRTLFPWHTSDNVLPARHVVDRFQVHKITVMY